MRSTSQVILLAEDDPHYASLIERGFQKIDAAISLHIVHDGEAAMAYLLGQGAYTDRERYPVPILMLLDLKLPRKSGLSLLSWMRERGLTSPPVVALTASEEPTEIKRAYELGIRSHHVKPSTFQGLLDMARSLLEGLAIQTGDGSAAGEEPV